MEFEIGGKKYRSTKMNAFDQLHVMRKLAPIFAGVGSMKDIMFTVTADVDGAEKNSAEEKSSAAVAAIAKAVSDIPEADLNSVLAKCCAATSREVGVAGFAPIWNRSANQLMYDDIEWIDLIQIVANVIGDNLGNFSTALPSMSNVRAG